MSEVYYLLAAISYGIFLVQFILSWFGQVTVYGNENTAGNFMAKTAENLNPAFDLLRSIPFADTLKSVLGKKELEEKKAETTEFEEVK